MDGTPGRPHTGVGFDKHVGHFRQWAAGQIPHLVDRLGPHETHQKSADVVDKRRVRYTQMRLEDILRHSGEVTIQRR